MIHFILFLRSEHTMIGAVQASFDIELDDNPTPASTSHCFLLSLGSAPTRTSAIHTHVSSNADEDIDDDDADIAAQNAFLGLKSPEQSSLLDMFGLANSTSNSVTRPQTAHADSSASNAKQSVSISKSTSSTSAQLSAQVKVKSHKASQPPSTQSSSFVDKNQSSGSKRKISDGEPVKSKKDRKAEQSTKPQSKSIGLKTEPVVKQPRQDNDEIDDIFDF
jgi:hypothetical protein